MDESANDLTILVEQLRSSGFRVDTRQYLTAHELLLAFARLGKPLDDTARLASHLGPIFCTLPDEQRRFASVVESWRGSGGVVANVSEPPATRPFSVWRRWRWRAIGGVLALALAIGTLVIAYVELAPVTLEGKVLVAAADGTTAPAPHASVRFRGEAVAVDSEGRFRLTTWRAAGEASLQAVLDDYTTASASVDADTAQPIVLTLQRAAPPPPPAPDAPFVVGNAKVVALGAPARTVRAGGPRWSVILGGAAIAGLVAWLTMVVVGRKKRRLALKRLQALGDADECTLRPADASAITLADHEIRRIASALRRPREQPLVELDAPASVEATLRAGGLFAPVYAARRAMPEYLVLVDRHGIDDHWAEWIDQWIERLDATGVAIERYTFHDDPRMCFGDDDKRRAHRLSELVAHHHRATLMVFAESAVFFDAFQDALAPWAGVLRPLLRRVVFTPEPPFRWGRREWQLAADGFVVLPAGVEGLKTYAEVTGDWRIDRLFPAAYARAYPRVIADEPQRYLDRNAPPDAIVETLIRQLRGYLGPDAFAWLCACAVYPQISWPLTLALAPAAGMPSARNSSRGATFDLLPALARLPWLREGFMPDWLREALIGALSPAQQTAVRTTLESLLEQLVLAASPEAVKAGVVQAAQPSRGSPLDISRWVGPLDLLRAAPPASPLRDRIFLGFVAGTSGDPLTMEVREAFRRLFGGEAGALPVSTSPASTTATSSSTSPGGRSLRARAQQAAGEARTLARSAMRRAGGWFALHPATGNALLSALVGIAAFGVLASALPPAQVPAPPTASFVAFSPDGKWLISSAADGGVAWLLTADLTPTLRPRYGAAASAAAFDRDGATLAIGYEDGGVEFIDIANQKTSGVRAKAGSARIQSMAYDAEGRLWTASAEQLMRIDPKQLQIEAGRPLAADLVRAVALDHSATRYAVLQPNGEMRVGNVDVSGQLSAYVDVPCSPTAAPVFSPDDRLLACGALSGALLLWDVSTGKVSNEAIVSSARALAGASTSEITSIAISADGRFAALGSSDGSVEFADLRTRQLSQGPRGSIEGGVRAVALSAAGDFVAAAGAGELDVWPITSRPVSSPEQTDLQQQAGTPPAPDVTQGRVGRVALPTLVGRTIPTALVMLERQKFQLDPPQTRASSATKGTIISQTPRGGSMVLPGSSVSVVVSDGSLVRVPNVVGAPIDGAQKMLAQVGLAVASIREADSIAAAGTIIDQQPKAGVDVPPRSTITLVVARAAGKQAAPNAPADAVQRNVPNQAQTAQSDGWCCMRAGAAIRQNALPNAALEPIRSTADECRKRGGEFYADEKEARARCVANPQPPVLVK